MPEPYHGCAPRGGKRRSLTRRTASPLATSARRLVRNRLRAKTAPGLRQEVANFAIRPCTTATGPTRDRCDDGRRVGPRESIGGRRDPRRRPQCVQFSIVKSVQFSIAIDRQHNGCSGLRRGSSGRCPCQAKNTKPLRCLTGVRHLVANQPHAAGWRERGSGSRARHDVLDMSTSFAAPKVRQV